jgi:Protein of unknown function (DUF4238)
MSETVKPKMTGRNDHFLPQGYLRGFIHPDRQNMPQPLWGYDVCRKIWRPRSTAQVGYQVGMYDAISQDEQRFVADDLFKNLENKYPKLIRELSETNFITWRHHFAFLMNFMQMICSRSPLFFKHAESVALGKNEALSLMHVEMLMGPRQLRDFDWALRWVDDPNDPCIATEQPFAMEHPTNLDGTAPTSAEAFLHSDKTWLYFPLCWNAVLFGSRAKITDPATDKFDLRDLHRVRRTYFTKAKDFVVSPLRLDQDGMPLARLSRP